MHATADDPKQQQAKVAAMEANALDLPCCIVVGTVVNGRYTVNEVLHRSATAITYSATDNITEKQVALTAVPLRGPCGSKQLEVLRHEAVVMQGLAHPGIPAYMDHFVEDAASDRAFYIVQEEVQGKSLADMVAAGMRADESQIKRIALGLLNILKYLGCLRPAVMHGDVKPENVVLGGGKWGGRVYLTGFRGVQWAAATGNLGLSSTGTGTYGYMAPEQFTGTASPASDLYGLGATLLYLLTGLEPQLLPKHRLRITWRDRVTVSKQLGDLLDGLLEPVAEDRLTAPEAISVATGKAAGSTRSPQPGDTLPRPPGTPNGPVRKPANSRVSLTSTIDSFDIYIPPLGCKGINIFLALFALAWNSFIGMFTYFAISGGIIFLFFFLTPFWFAGYQVTRAAFENVFTPEHLAIGHKKWRLSQGFGLLEGVAARLGWEYAQEGQTCDLSGASVVVTGVCNEVPLTAVEIAEGVRKFRFGGSLDRLEQDWLVWEINTHIADLEGRGSALEDTSETDKLITSKDSGATATMMKL